MWAHAVLRVDNRRACWKWRVAQQPRKNPPAEPRTSKRAIVSLHGERPVTGMGSHEAASVGRPRGVRPVS